MAYRSGVLNLLFCFSPPGTALVFKYFSILCVLTWKIPGNRSSQLFPASFCFFAFFRHGCSKQSMQRCLFISKRFFSHQTCPNCSDLPVGFVILALLHSKQWLLFLPFIGMKQGICLFNAIWVPRWAHQTVPGDGLWPPGFVSCPSLHSLHELFMNF